MKKIIDYHVFDAHAVHAAIKDGWQPWGQPIYTSSGVAQVCVRYEDDTKLPRPH